MRHVSGGPIIDRRLSIRVATPEDREAVTRLLQRSYPALMAGSYEPAVLAAALPLMTQANPALLASGTFVVAVAEVVRFSASSDSDAWRASTPRNSTCPKGLLRPAVEWSCWATRSRFRASICSGQSDLLNTLDSK